MSAARAKQNIRHVPPPLPGMVLVEIEVDQCQRCSWWWQRRDEVAAKVCPKCKSPYWNRPRRDTGAGK